MTTDTATIRVTRKTRDLLSEYARERGISLASLLAEIARERESEALLSSERDASLADAQRSDLAEEDRVWETALADGLD